MAIVNCPICRRKISDKGKECPSCGSTTDMDADQRRQIAHGLHRKKLQNIATQNMLAVIIAMAGFYMMYFQAPDENSWQLKLSQLALAIGFAWYIVNRVRYFLIKSLMRNS